MTQNQAFDKMEDHFIAGLTPARGPIATLCIARFVGNVPRILILAIFASIMVAPALGQPVSQMGFGSAGVAQAPDVRWIESLIAEGFSKMAVDVCESRLKFYAPDSDAHAQWMMLAMHARTAWKLDTFDFSSDPTVLDAIPSQVASLAEGMRGTPRELWIRWKAIWCRWLIQQRGLANYLAAPTREPLKLWILGSIRESLDATEQLEQEIRKLPTGLGKAIANDQKLDLQGRLALLQADILFQRSKCYASGSDDANTAAAEMLQSLDDALSKLPADWIHRPSLAIARVSSLIQLQRYDDAIQSANKLWDGLTSEQNKRAATVRYEEALAVVGARASRFRNQKEDFEVWIARGGGAMASPELAMEQFAADLAWGGDQATAKALDWKREVGKKFGAYWEQRLDALLMSNEATANRPEKIPSLEILRIEVRQLLAAKRWDEAIVKLRQAEFAAAQLHADDEAFAFGMQVAAACESQGKRQEAATAFFESACRYPTQPKAAAAALMGAWLIRPLADASSPPTTEQMELYRRRLQETAAQWPETDAAKQAVDWLERDRLSRDDLAPVIALWDLRCRSTKSTSSAIGRYLLGLCVMNDAWIEPSRPINKDLVTAMASLRETLADTYQEIDRDRFRGWITKTDADLRWSIPIVEGDSTTTLGSVACLVSGTGNGPFTEDAIQRALVAWEEDPISRLAILWYACESRAFAILARPTPAVQQEYQAIGLLLRKLQQEKNSLGTLRLGPAVDDSLQRSIRFYEMLPSGGDAEWATVLKQMEREREADQKSAWWLYRSARVMQCLESHRQEAIPWYRLMASGFPAGSEPWLEARARTAQTLRWSNDLAAADQLRDLVLATYPKVESTWRIRFEAK